MGFLKFFSDIFGGGRNVIRETVEVFRPNAEGQSQRDASARGAAMGQFGNEFGGKGWFNSMIDGLNRLPRPMLSLGVIALIVSAMTDPIWFAERMVGLALVPDPLWALLGIIVTFYFGGRHQIKAQEFRAAMATMPDRAVAAVASIAVIRAIEHDTPGAASSGGDAALSEAALEAGTNAAVAAWKSSK